MRKCVIKKIEDEKEWDANSYLIPTSALGPRAEGATDHCMTSLSDKEPARRSERASVNIPQAAIESI